MIGIYSIKNKINNKEYIGQSIDIETRWSNHQRLLKKGQHENYLLQDDYNLYGDNSFDYLVLEECSKDELCEREKYWIEKKKSKGQGYNLCDGGFGISNPTLEIRNKISKGLSGSNNGMYGIRLMGKDNPHYGKHHTEETKNKLSLLAKLRIGEHSPRSKKVQASTGEIFCSAIEAHKWCGACNSAIGKVCKGLAKTAGKHPVTKERLSWRYI